MHGIPATLHGVGDGNSAVISSLQNNCTMHILAGPLAPVDEATANPCGKQPLGGAMKQLFTKAIGAIK